MKPNAFKKPLIVHDVSGSFESTFMMVAGTDYHRMMLHYAHSGIEKNEMVRQMVKYKNTCSTVHLLDLILGDAINSCYGTLVEIRK